MEHDDTILADNSFIGNPPSWFLLYGSIVLGLLLILALLFSMTISYNSVIKSRLSVTTTTPPIYISPTKTGFLKKINVTSGSQVQQGDILAIMDNTSESETVFDLLETLKGNFDTITSTEQLSKNFPLNLNLGEIQKPYNAFRTAYQVYIDFTFYQRQKKKGINLNLQATDQSSAVRNQLQLLNLSKQKQVIVQEAYEKNRTLFMKGVISQSELRNYETEFLDAKQAVQNNQQELALLGVESNRLKNAYTDNDLNILELQNFYITSLNSTKQLLLESIYSWRETNVLIAPTDGTVSVFDVWEKYQHVQEGDFIFSIVPQNGGKVIGKLQVPITNSGKIEVGQKVIVKLDNYPYNEWGSLSGNIAHISEVPKKGDFAYYSVYIDMDNLNTSFDKTIVFKQEMSGDAEIILDKVSLIQRIFYQFRTIWE